jgi:hypothetical protein
MAMSILFQKERHKSREWRKSRSYQTKENPVQFMLFEELKEYITSTRRGRNRNTIVAIKTVWEKEKPFR